MSMLVRFQTAAYTSLLCFFFFQAEDGIRDIGVTGVQTCALPIWRKHRRQRGLRLALMAYLAGPGARNQSKVDGFTSEQRVFLGWAQVWCENARPEAERLKAAKIGRASCRERV